MFCSKCGRQIGDGSRFCQYCGETQEAVKSAPGNIPSAESGRNKDFLLGMSALDIIICIVYIILAFWWTDKFFSNLKINWQSFKVLASDVRFLGIVIYIIPYAFVLCMCIVAILGLKQHRYHISSGIMICCIAFVLKIGTYFIDEVSFKAYMIIANRVFGAYGSIGISTIILGMIVTALSYTKARNH